MQILSHRGYWQHPSEKNTEAAFRRSFLLGYGTETDIRDRDGTDDDADTGSGMDCHARVYGLEENGIQDSPL
jgi:hypothetical protein